MPQTLLALLAIAAASILVLQGSRDQMMDAAQMRELDAVVTARGIGVEVLERLSGVPFDGGEGGLPGDLGILSYSPQAFFGSDSSSAGRPMDELFTNPGWDDLDDYDAVDGAIASVEIADPTSGTTQAQEFTLDIQVRYVSQDPTTGDWQPVASAVLRTPHKRARVTIDSPELSTALQFARIYAAP